MITIIGTGRVGSSTAAMLALKELDDLMLIDIVPNLPQGEALDLGHALAELGIDIRVRGSNDYSDMRGSDLVVVTAGFPRKPGMTREELVGKNAEVVRSIAGNIKKYAPDSIVILVTNPLDPMIYLMYKLLGFPRERVIGFSGILDSRRLAYYASLKLGVAPSSISPVVIGQHGEKMFPVPRLSSVAGVPLTQVMSQKDIEEIVKQTIDAGAEVTKLRGFSSNWAPGAGVAVMAESIKRDLKRVFFASVYLDGEYGVKDVTVDVPVVLGRRGVEKVLELPLTDEERKGFLASVDAIRANLAQIPPEYFKI
ncbi:MAG: malate dehydrogenase [Nitrososphaeria archaeon]|jgi:malate dehydrogenase